MLHFSHHSALTCENSGHHGGEHKEEDGEEDAARVAGDLGRLVADAEVDHADQQADHQVRQEPHQRQVLRQPIRALTSRQTSAQPDSLSAIFFHLLDAKNFSVFNLSPLSPDFDRDSDF